MLSGECKTNEWKESRVVLVRKGPSKKELTNYIQLKIINMVCKFMMVVREIINELEEESGMLG